MSSLIIAEKPDLAKAIGEALSGSMKYSDGYFTVADYTITWCYGHMLRLKEPEEYDEKYKEWNIAQLPIFFENWASLPSTSARSQLRVIKALLDSASEVIHAGDPDEEGQLIVDEILAYYKYKGIVKRILVNDNNPDQVLKAFDGLSDNSKFEPLGKSAHARAVTDKMFGYTLSRFFSVTQKMKASVGRVQTPTLGLIVKRDELIENFKELFYYVVKAEVDITAPVTLTWHPDKENEYLEEGKLLDEEYANKSSSEHVGAALRIVVSSKETKKSPPLPFNLTKLQAYANKSFGYSPKQTLDITQSLREKYKAITYNRSDSQYLNDEHYAEAPAVLSAAFGNLGSSLPVIVDTGIKSACFDGSKVTAHHAIIPTKASFDASALTEPERNGYELFVNFYAVQFMPQAIYYNKEAIADSPLGGELKASAKKQIHPGYLSFFSSSDDEENSKDDDTLSASLIDVPDGEYTADIVNTFVEKKETSPPKRYTVAALITDMAQIAKYVSDPGMKKILKEKDDGKAGENGGIGTSATRGDVIEKLLDPKRGYVEEKGKQLISTDKGRQFYNMLPDDVKTADVTAQWWLIQEDIKSGAASEDVLFDSVLETLNIAIKGDYKQIEIPKPDRESIGKCPVCGGDVYENVKAFSCEHTRDKTCPFVIFKDNKFFSWKGKKVTKTAVKSLLTSGRVKMTGLKNKEGKVYDAIFVMQPMARTDKWVSFALEFENKKK